MQSQPAQGVQCQNWLLVNKLSLKSNFVVCFHLEFYIKDSFILSSKQRLQEAELPFYLSSKKCRGFELNT